MQTPVPRALISLIDDEGLSAYQTSVIAMCALIAMLDGFDTQSIGFVAGSIATEWHLPVTSFGPIFAIGLLGGLFGALGFGALADRYGRKGALVLSVCIFAAGALLTGWSRSVFQLSVLRFVTGLGLGGAMPSIISMTAEYAPRRLRATLVTVMFCGFPLGAVLGAIGCTKLLPLFGWRSIFVVGGSLPLLLLPFLIFAMPESVRWLAARGRIDEIGEILKRFRRDSLWDRSVLIEKPDTQPQTSILGLFASRRLLGTLLLWLTSFMSLLMVYLLVSWIPTIALQSGGRPNIGLVAAAILNISGIAGSICFGRLSDKFGEFGVVSTGYIGGACLVLLVASTTELNASILWLAGISGFFCIGAQLCVVAIASGYYPLALRASGVGCTMGMGRLGAIIGPLVGAGLIGGSHSPVPVFCFLAFTSLVSGFAIFAVGKAPRSND